MSNNDPNRPKTFKTSKCEEIVRNIEKKNSFDFDPVKRMRHGAHTLHARIFCCPGLVFDAKPPKQNKCCSILMIFLNLFTQFV